MARARNLLPNLPLFLALAGSPAVGQAPVPAAPPAPDPGLPAGLEVEPNAIQDLAQPMKVRVAGISRGAKAHFQVLQDCTGDERPDLTGNASCTSPLLEWDSAAAKGDDGISDQLDFQKLAAQGKPLPTERKLWLRAARKGSGQALYAMFGLVEDPCTLWQTALDTFRRGPCKLGLGQALLRHRGLAQQDGRLEVRWLGFSPQAQPACSSCGPPSPEKVPDRQPATVAGTQGATGVAWLDAKTLLITVAAAGQPARLMRVPLRGDAPQLLWEAQAGDVRKAAAPLALPGGRVAFSRQGAGSAALSIWSKDGVDPARDLPLPAPLHQLIAVDPAGTRLLALTLGVEGNRPAFLRLDLAARTVEDLGFHPALYQAVFQMPGGKHSVVAFEDNSSQTGWDLVLVDAAGQLAAELQTRPEDDLQPAWRPDGDGLAFLAEVTDEVKKEKP